MTLEYLKTTYLVENSRIVTVENENYFGTVLSQLADSKNMEEFEESMKKYPEVDYTVRELAKTDTEE